MIVRSKLPRTRTWLHLDAWQQHPRSCLSGIELNFLLDTWRQVWTSRLQEGQQILYHWVTGSWVFCWAGAGAVEGAANEQGPSILDGIALVGIIMGIGAICRPNHGGGGPDAGGKLRLVLACGYHGGQGKEGNG